MKYLLDTNVCVRYLNGESDLLRRRLQKTNLEDIAVCSVVKMELFYGAMRSNNPDVSWRKQQRFLEVLVSLPFDDIAALIAGRVRAHLVNLGTPIGANDCYACEDGARYKEQNNRILLSTTVLPEHPPSAIA
jgi:tRNA(fMet)-specific endonuclease VapC